MYGSKLHKEVDLDQIAELPEDVIRHILSFLPIKDATRTSALSKSWKRACRSYIILQSLNFDHNSFALKLLLSSERGKEPEVHAIRNDFIDHVKSDLLLKKPSAVLKLTLNVAVIDAEFSHVHQLMELVGQIKVEELYIFVQTIHTCWCEDISLSNQMSMEGTFYDFPYLEVVLASKWLQSLTVRGCRLSLAAGSYVVGVFSSLQRLWLSHVMVADEETLRNMARSCPLLEVIKFESCTFWMETLKLSIFHKLKKAFVLGYQYGEISCVDISETNIETFHCTDVAMDYVLNQDGRSHIRELILETLVSFEDLTGVFPLVEEVDLEMEGETGEINRFKAANDQLKTLDLFVDRSIILNELYVDCPKLRHFDFCGLGPEKVYVDCPSLREFDYRGEQVPTLLSFNLPADKCVVQFKLDLNHFFNTLAFVHLREFLEKIAGRKMYLHLIFYTRWKAIFVLDEFRAKIQTSQQINVHLKVDVVDNRVYFSNLCPAAFVDGLIWSTYPTTMILRGDCCKIVEYLYEKLACKGRDGSCCEQFCNKFWWHNIDDFEAKSVIEDMKEYVVTMAKMHKRSSKKVFWFSFKWHSNLH